MGCTPEAIEVFETSRKGAKSLKDGGVCWYAPGKSSSTSSSSAIRNIK